MLHVNKVGRIICFFFVLLSTIEQNGSEIFASFILGELRKQQRSYQRCHVIKVDRIICLIVFCFCIFCVFLSTLEQNGFEIFTFLIFLI